jgi:hypothetical protein
MPLARYRKRAKGFCGRDSVRAQITTQQRLLIVFTALITFFAGVLAAQGRDSLAVAVLTILALCWLLAGILQPREKTGQ